MPVLPDHSRLTTQGTGLETSAGHSSRSPRLFQIFYLPAQAEQLEPEFIPYSNVENPRPEWCEYHVFRKEYQAGTCDHGITGFVSWKFRQKTGMSGEAFCSSIEAHPGYDVYFVNPFPRLAKRWMPNVWRQGDQCHPRLSQITQSLLDKLGYKVNLRSLRMREQHIAYCNYWAGTPQFWQRYMQFCEPIYDLIENGLSHDERAVLLKRADVYSDSCYIPYIFERLFPTLLCIDDDIRALRMHPGAKRRRTWGEWVGREVSRPYRRYMAKRQAAAASPQRKSA